MPAYVDYRAGLSPVAVWPLNGDGNDIIGSRHLTPSATLTYAQGCRDGSLAFVGDATNYLSRAAESSIGGLTTNFSVEFWFKPAAALTTRCMVSCGRAGQTGWNHYLYNKFTSAKNGIAAVDPLAVQQRGGVWYHIVVTMGADNKFRFYYNGILWHTGTNAAALNSAAAHNFYVGADQSGAGVVGEPMLAGDMIQDVAVYPTALSDIQVANLYQYGCQGTMSMALGDAGYNIREAVVLTPGRSHPDSWVKTRINHSAFVAAVGASGSVRATDANGVILPTSVSLATAGLVDVKVALPGQEYLTGKNCWIYGKNTADNLPYRSWGTPLPAFAGTAAVAANIMPAITVTKDGSTGPVAAGTDWWHPSVLVPPAGHWTAKETDNGADTVTHIMVNTPVVTSQGGSSNHYENPHAFIEVNGVFSLVTSVTEPLDPWPGTGLFNADNNICYQHGGTELWLYYREAPSRLLRRKLTGSSWASLVVGPEVECTLNGGAELPVAPCVQWDDANNCYRLFGSGQSSPSKQSSQVFMWTSTDGLVWNNPVSLFGPDDTVEGHTRAYGNWHGSVIWHPATNHWYACYSEVALGGGPTGGPTRMWRCPTLTGQWEPMRAHLLPSHLYPYQHSLVLEADGGLSVYFSQVGGGASYGVYRTRINVSTMHPVSFDTTFGFGYTETATGETATYYTRTPTSNADTTWSLVAVEQAAAATQLATDEATVTSQLTAQVGQISGEITVLDQSITGTAEDTVGDALIANGYTTALASKLAMLNSARISFAGPMTTTGSFIFHAGDDVTLSWSFNYAGTVDSATIDLIGEATYQAGGSPFIEKACTVSQVAGVVTISVTLTSAETVNLPSVLNSVNHNLRAQVTIVDGQNTLTVIDHTGICLKRVVPAA